MSVNRSKYRYISPKEAVKEEMEAEEAERERQEEALYGYDARRDGTASPHTWGRE